MSGWSHHTGKAMALDLENIDTDQLIPARFMSVPRVQGYGPYLLHDMRRTEGGTLRADFPLNRHPTASVLVTRRNFGSGSSREAAVYALVDAGIRAVIAPTFGDIFSGNAVNNGLLPLTLPSAAVDALLTTLGTDTTEVAIDLAQGHLRLGPHLYEFALMLVVCRRASQDIGKRV